MANTFHISGGQDPYVVAPGATSSATTECPKLCLAPAGCTPSFKDIPIHHHLPVTDLGPP